MHWAQRCRFRTCLTWSHLPMEKVTKAVLRYLFQEYLKGPTVLYSTNGITDSFKSDAVAVSNFMM